MRKNSSRALAAQRLDAMLGAFVALLGLLALRYLYYFALFFEQLVRLWLGT